MKLVTLIDYLISRFANGGHVIRALVITFSNVITTSIIVVVSTVIKCTVTGEVILTN